MLEDFISNLRISVITGAYTLCPVNWRDVDYIPDYNKFYFIEDGEGWLKIGGREYRPKPGQLFLMPAGVLQSYSTVGSHPFEKYWCHFAAKIGDINLFDVLEIPHFVDVEDREEMAALFQRLIAEHEGSGLSACLRVKSALLEIIARYLRLAGVQELKFKRLSALHDFNIVLAYIQEHIHQELSAGELANRFHYNPNYFTRLFRKYTGLAPTQYVNKTRLEKAKTLLRTSDMMISDVASVTGFGDIFYFSKSFKRYTGFSPTDYRAL